MRLHYARTLEVEQCNHGFCCGVDEVGNFSFYEDGFEGEGEDEFYTPMISRSGTGLFTATFIDSLDCHEAYKYLISKYKLLYQSPVRVNSSSENSVFLCVFDFDTDKLPRL
jgi:hypothetical protein